MTGQLTYRLSQEADAPGLLRLWKENASHNSYPPESWRRWYIDSTPYGPNLAVVAVDENGDIAGQIILTPSRVLIGEREVRALRLSTVVLRRGLAGSSLPWERAALRGMEHPLLGLYRAAEEVAVAGGYGLWYAMPRQALLRPFRWLGGFLGQEIVIAEYGCVETAVSLALPVAGEARSLTVRPTTDFGPQHEELWQSVINSFPTTCGVVRSPSWLGYNNARYLNLDIRDARTDTLLGYTAIRTHPPLLCDMLARTPAGVAPVLGAALDWLAQQSDAEVDGVGYLSAMVTPVLGPALNAVGFRPVNYKFAFVCRALDSSISTEAIAPQQWYVTPGDHGP
jgi:hypothetical protein